MAAVTVGAIPLLQAMDLLGMGVLAGLVATAGGGPRDSRLRRYHPDTRRARLGGLSLERVAGLNSGAGKAGLLLGAPGAAGRHRPCHSLVHRRGYVRRRGRPHRGSGALTAQPDTEPADQAARPRYFPQLAEGLRFVRPDRLLLALIIMIAVSNLLDYALFAVLLPVWVQDRLGAPEVLGPILGASGVGAALLGNLIGAWLAPRLPRRATYAIGFLIGGAPLFVALAASTTLWLPITVAFIGGLNTGSINPILGAVAYERIPPPLLARVMGVVKASACVGIPIGPPESSSTTPAYKPRCSSPQRACSPPPSPRSSYVPSPK